MQRLVKIQIDLLWLKGREIECQRYLWTMKCRIFIFSKHTEEVAEKATEFQERRLHSNSEFLIH